MESQPAMSPAPSGATPNILQWIVLAQCLVLLFIASWYLFGRRDQVIVDQEAGRAFNEAAWEASYAERGLPIPPGGPREGYWAARLNEKIYDPVLVWRHAEQDIPSLVSIDANGFQYARAKGGEPLKLMILGGSVAFGAYASDEAHTYYARLRDMLAERGVPVDITVVAAGAWKTVQSTAAFRKHYDAVRPDMVIFFNGLNSLTVGSNAETLYGQPTITEGGELVLIENTQDYDARAEKYIEMMSGARAFARSAGIALTVVLQPAPFEKRIRSQLEESIFTEYRKIYGPGENLRTGYQTMREAMDGLAQASSRTHFLDLSRVFNEETATTFADMWHFSDPGHEIVAEAMADFLEPILRTERGIK